MKIAKFLEPALKRAALRALVSRRGNSLLAPAPISNLRRVLVYRPERFGDLLSTLPLLSQLRTALPAAQLTVWTSAAGKELLEHELNPDEVIIVTGKSADRRRAIQTQSFDLVIDMVMRDSVNSLLASAPAARDGVLAGWGKDRLRPYYDWAPAMPEVSDVYAPELNCRVMRLFGVSNQAGLRVALTYTPAERRQATEAVGAAMGPIVLNFSAGDVSRLWPEKNWRRVAEWLAKESDAPLWLNAQAADQVRAICIADAYPQRIRVLPSMSFRAAACVVSQASLFVSADTSLVHIAAGAGVPAVAMYLPRRDTRMTWIPPYSNVRALRAADGYGLESITPDNIISAIESLQSMVTAPLRTP